MPSTPSVTLPKPPDGWSYSVDLVGPRGQAVKVTSTSEGCRITTDEVDGTVTAPDLPAALKTAVTIAKTIANRDKARALVEEGEKVLASMLPRPQAAPAPGGPVAAKSEG